MESGESDYCLLCQEPHITSQECLKKVVCKGCGQLGHLKRNCLLRKGREIELESGATDLTAVPVDSHASKVVIQSKECEKPSQKKDYLRVRVKDPTETVVESELPDEASDVRRSRKRKRNASVEALPRPVDPLQKVAQSESDPQVVGEGLSTETPTKKKSRIPMTPTSPENLSPSKYSAGQDYQENVHAKPTVMEKQAGSSERSFQVHISNSEEETYPQSLPPENEYEFVCVHIETVKRSWSTKTVLTQIGCSSALNRNVENKNECFFRAIKPRGGAVDLWSCYQILEKVDWRSSWKTTPSEETCCRPSLHMTREEDGTFKFRGQFEVENDPSEAVVCCSEETALRDFTSHLANKFEKDVVLVAVDEDSLAILVDKMTSLSSEFSKKVIGFTYWKRVIDLSGFPNTGGSELEEFVDKRKELKNFVRPGKFLNAKDISEVLRASLEFVSQQYDGRSEGYQLSCQRLEDLPKPKKANVNSETEEFIEVSNNFRPAVTTTMGVKRKEVVHIGSDSEEEGLEENFPIQECEANTKELETIVIHSDSDEDVEVVVMSQTQGVNAETTKQQKDLFTSASLLEDESRVNIVKRLSSQNSESTVRTQNNVDSSSKSVSISGLFIPRSDLIYCHLCPCLVLLNVANMKKHIKKMHKKPTSLKAGIKLIQCPHCDQQVKPTKIGKHISKHNSNFHINHQKKKTNQSNTQPISGQNSSESPNSNNTLEENPILHPELKKPSCNPDTRSEEGRKKKEQLKKTKKNKKKDKKKNKKKENSVSSVGLSCSRLLGQRKAQKILKMEMLSKTEETNSEFLGKPE